MGQGTKALGDQTVKRTSKPSAGARIIKALTELLEALESGEPLEKRFIVRTLERPTPKRQSRKSKARSRRL
jgi:hypothetical protein